VERRTILVHGIVQGVGFRPFVYNLATRLQLNGSVRNQSGSVFIEVEGEPACMDRFLAELRQRPPPLARIDNLTWAPEVPRGDMDFRIESSQTGAGEPIFFSPDVATCDQCLAEMFDPKDRRYLYPFLNCTNCGPRLTIIRGAPYDRPRTTMASFVMCAACRAEYEDPANRRFHAQPTACAVCGPHLQASDGQGQVCQCRDPVQLFLETIGDGKIAAVKGIGGYHLACDAQNVGAVRTLRLRKHRDDKPFAVMVRDAETAQHLCHLDDVERRLLESPRRPIVLLRKRSPCLVAEEVAPANPCLGVMLPYSPLHHLLFHYLGEKPLVMTSGNQSDEPIAYRDDEALSRLSGIADLFLTHNRPIHVRCDDSVTRVVAGLELPIRRSRGYAPQPVAMPFECPVPMLAVGGQLKATFTLGQGRQAFLSHHLGDLDHYDAYKAFEKDVALYQELFRIRPQLLVHDLHPDYSTTRYAVERAEQENIRLLAIQHHHAHVASCMAEHQLDGPVIGVAFDGTGFGTDGTIWGGEFFVGDYGRFRRLGHLRCVPMPGGDSAIRQPWRMALAHLVDAKGPSLSMEARISLLRYKTVARMIERRFNSPFTSSAGRLFDAVAALVGVRDEVTYEGQAAVELEWLASPYPPDACYPFELSDTTGPDNSRVLEVDTRPLIRSVAEEVEKGAEPGRIARRFHSTMVEIIVAVCGLIRKQTGLNDVVLSGGVFLNALLTGELMDRLGKESFAGYRQHLAPPNDGGLSLGQLAIAARRISESGKGTSASSCISL
jgi:hydrogenase maturation protein HypF